MDDVRVLWMRDRVYCAFGLTDPQIFEELLSRNDGEVEDEVLHFLNQASDEEAAATLFFYRTVVQEEVAVRLGERRGPGAPAGLRLRQKSRAGPGGAPEHRRR